MRIFKIANAFICSYFLILPSIVLGNTLLVTDTCTINDHCQDAIVIDEVISDHSFVCLSGCNQYASPDAFIQTCQMADFPTVWYRFQSDNVAATMNIEVKSVDFEAPVIAVFTSFNDCNDLEPVYLTANNLSCIIGSDGTAKAIGTKITSNTTYYLAISSHMSIGGNFEVCVSTLSTGFICVLNRTVEIVARSNPGPLEGPFDPNEKITICMNVNEYTAENNGCQWFQGIIPVFGNGWDPSSFDLDGQPLNSTLNGDTIGESGNGLYGSATWDWFLDVDYHHDHPSLMVSDLDNNGNVDLCNSVYETDCPAGGIPGGCCTPCWDTLGTILPGGWFAYGINGTCHIPGPPVRVDWGDGNTCGGGMGPWHICFDLITRDVPDCQEDSTKKDLSLGFFTFADGETGAWTGSNSVCALDAPLKLTLKAHCGRVAQGGIEELPPLCHGDTLFYQIEEPGINNWEWNISPFWAAPYIINTGDNGFMVTAPLVNTSGEPVEITGVFIGHEAGTPDILLKKIKFTVDDVTSCPTVSVESSGYVKTNFIRVHPMPAKESAWLEWSSDLQQRATILIYDSHGIEKKQIEILPGDGNKTEISLNHWTPGIYFVSISNDNFRAITKMVKL